MSLHPQPSTPVPPQTRQVAQAAFPRGNRYLQLRDTLGTLYDDTLFADLFPPRGQAAQAPWQLALVTLLQFAENLSDRQAADAVRSRLDWKYLLGLELTAPGFNFSILSEFRQRLVAAKAEERLLNQQGLADQSLLPSQQLVDTAYVSAELLVQSQHLHQVELVGPARKDQKWQALARQGYAAADFHVDWDAQQVTCPQGHPSQSWLKTLEKGQPRVYIKFSRKHCGPCPVHAQCTRMKRRAIKLRADAPYHALQAARVRDSQADWLLLYNQRAGIEGTLSQGGRGFGMRRSRYVGLAKTHLQHVFIAAAMNLSRIVNWLNEVPLAQTRQAAFKRLTTPAMA